VQERICSAIRAGNYAETACRLAGVSPSTFYRWRTRGEQEESGIYADFQEAVEAAEGAAESDLVAVIQSAIPNDPRLAMAFLERRFRQHWGRQSKAEKEKDKPTNGAVNLIFRTITDENGNSKSVIEYPDDADEETESENDVADENTPNDDSTMNTPPTPVAPPPPVPTSAHILPPRKEPVPTSAHILPPRKEDVTTRADPGSLQSA